MQLLNTLFNKKTTTVNTAKEEAVEPTTNVVPGEWFTSKEHYLDFRAAFKKYVNSDDKYALQPVHFIIYAILRNRDWRDGWTIPQHPGKKIENQAKLSSAWQMIKSPWCENLILKPFDGTITTEMLIALRENLDEYRKLKK